MFHRPGGWRRTAAVRPAESCFAPKPSPAEELTDRIAERAVALFGDEPLAVGREMLS